MAKSGSGLFDPAPIADEIALARSESRAMVRGLTGIFGPSGQLTMAHLPFLSFIERSQAFSLGAATMIESGNPLAAATLLRSFAENLAVVFYIQAHPQDIDKLQPGARHSIKVGRIISQAEKHLPGFKAMYDELSARAHPTGKGSYQNFVVAGEGQFTWQSHPTFVDVQDARALLQRLRDLTKLTAEVIKNTAAELSAPHRAFS